MMRLSLTRSVTGVGAATTLILGTAFAGGALADEAPVTMAAVLPAASAVDADRPSVVSNDHDEQRIRKLHDRLGITATQEDLWGQLAQVMRTNDGKMDDLSAVRHGRAMSMTAVEDLRSYGEITEAHAAGIRAFVPAFESLYNRMSATQKTNADNVFRHVATKSPKKAN